MFGIGIKVNLLSYCFLPDGCVLILLKVGWNTFVLLLDRSDSCFLNRPIDNLFFGYYIHQSLLLLISGLVSNLLNGRFSLHLLKNLAILPRFFVSNTTNQCVLPYGVHLDPPRAESHILVDGVVLIVQLSHCGCAIYSKQEAEHFLIHFVFIIN